MPNQLKQESIIQLAKEFYPFFKNKFKKEFGNNLKGSCGLASWAFQELVSKCNGKIQTYYGFCSGEYHCWNQIDNRIIDLTYQQFSKRTKAPFITKNTKIYTPKIKVEDPYFFEFWETWPFIADSSSLINEFLNKKVIKVA